MEPGGAETGKTAENGRRAAARAVVLFLLPFALPLRYRYPASPRIISTVFSATFSSVPGGSLPQAS